MCGGNRAHFPLKLNQAYYVRERLIKLSLVVVEKLVSAQALRPGVPAGRAHFPFQRKVIRII